MKRVTIGEFEELCLLVVGILADDAYGISVKKEVESRSGRKVTISTIHSTMMRLEKKGLLTSHMGGASDSRGGRAKRLFELTGAGKQAILEVRDLRNEMWQDIRGISWESL